MNKNVTLTLTSDEVQELLHILDYMTEQAVDNDCEFTDAYISLTDKIYAQAKL